MKNQQPKKRLKLTAIDPAFIGKVNETDAALQLKKLRKQMSKFQERLYANHSRSLLIVLQGIDASGKDGTIKSVMTGINPLGCQVHAFKAPVGNEVDHDYLWRIHQVLPPKGFIGIFNRSHYEDILVPSVHRLKEKDVLNRRFNHINDFERMLSDEGTKILKFFLHISKDEQRRRLNDRLTDPDKNWKYSKKDLIERRSWNAYQDVYESILSRCSTKWAPWTIVPADNKWYRNLVIATEIVNTLRELKQKFPVFDPAY